MGTSREGELGRTLRLEVASEIVKTRGFIIEGGMVGDTGSANGTTSGPSSFDESRCNSVVSVTASPWPSSFCVGSLGDLGEDASTMTGIGAEEAPSLSPEPFPAPVPFILSSLALSLSIMVNLPCVRPSFDPFILNEAFIFPSSEASKA